jgi:hypothetical protein
MLTDKCSYEKGAGSDEDITVNENGIVSVSAGATVADSATIIVSYSAGEASYTDTIIVNVSE